MSVPQQHRSMRLATERRLRTEPEGGVDGWLRVGGGEKEEPGMMTESRLGTIESSSKRTTFVGQSGRTVCSVPILYEEREIASTAVW